MSAETHPNQELPSFALSRPVKRQRLCSPGSEGEQQSASKTFPSRIEEEASTPTNKRLQASLQSTSPPTVTSRRVVSLAASLVTDEDESSVSTTTRDEEQSDFQEQGVLSEEEGEDFEESASACSDMDSVDQQQLRKEDNIYFLLNDYMLQTPVSERKEHILLNIRDSKLREVYFSGPEEGYGVRAAPMTRLFEKAFLGKALVLEIRSHESPSSGALSRRRLTNETDYFLVWELASYIINEARGVPSCGPQLKRLEIVSPPRYYQDSSPRKSGHDPILIAEFGPL
jgi:hypothetical protein